MYEPIAYVYDADVHCPDCARKRFGKALDDPETVDSESNTIGVISPWDEAGDPESGEYCGDCGTEIIEPQEGEPDGGEPPVVCAEYEGICRYVAENGTHVGCKGPYKLASESAEAECPYAEEPH